MWLVFALLSALFAAATAILAKIGLNDIDSNLATAIRTAVVFVLAWGMVFLTGAQKGIHTLTRNNATFLVLSGIATGLSWLCYYRALQMADVSKVVPIDKLSIVLTLIMAFVILKEPFTLKTGLATTLITAGVLILAVK